MLLTGITLKKDLKKGWCKFIGRYAIKINVNFYVRDSLESTFLV